MIVDSDTVRLLAEVPEYLGCSTHGGFCVDHPFLSKQRVNEGVELRGILKSRARSRELQALCTVNSPQRVEEFATKDTAEHFDWQEESVPWVHPVLVIWGEPTGRYDTVHMGMRVRFCRTCAGYSESDLRAQVLGIGGTLQHGRRAGAEQEIVQNPRVSLAQRRQRMRQSEDHMEIRSAQQLLFLAVSQRWRAWA